MWNDQTTQKICDQGNTRVGLDQTTQPSLDGQHSAYELRHAETVGIFCGSRLNSDHNFVTKNIMVDFDFDCTGIVPSCSTWC